MPPIKNIFSNSKNTFVPNLKKCPQLKPFFQIPLIHLSPFAPNLKKMRPIKKKNIFKFHSLSQIFHICYFVLFSCFFYIHHFMSLTILLTDHCTVNWNKGRQTEKKASGERNRCHAKERIVRGWGEGVKVENGSSIMYSFDERKHRLKRLISIIIQLYCFHS